MKQINNSKTSDIFKQFKIDIDNSYKKELLSNLNSYQKTLLQAKEARNKKSGFQIFKIILTVFSICFIFIVGGYLVTNNYLKKNEIFDLGNKVSAYYKSILEKYVIYEKVRVKEGKDIAELKNLNLPEIKDLIEPRNFEAEYWEFEDNTGYYSKLETLEYTLQKIPGNRIYVKPKNSTLPDYTRLDIDVLSSDRLAENLFSKGNVEILSDGNAEITVRSKFGTITEVKQYYIDTKTNQVLKVISSLELSIDGITKTYEYESVEILESTFIETTDNYNFIQFPLK